MTKINIEQIQNTAPNGRKLSVIARDGTDITLRTKVDGVSIYESYCWKLSTESTDALIGGEVYFHDHKADPSYFGGRVIGVERVRDGQHVGRAIIIFAAQNSCRGVTCPGGWSREKSFWNMAD